MSHELFVELSDEQQQLVAGGGLEIKDILGTFYKQRQDVTVLSVHQASGPGGSANKQVYQNVSSEITTGAFKKFFVY